ncbi:TPR-like protein [Sporormia fimetaria CBS 119925]|uniref:TPR-like protein n=1 Tax=Sporormia fimetaria CBS 119925 TaxID=1340428 RepID=A0A6A6VFF4_9PLEO|nr:TPR-like protein [Sporormia fimetaria CBS 119925]
MSNQDYYGNQQGGGYSQPPGYDAYNNPPHQGQGQSYDQYNQGYNSQQQYNAPPPQHPQDQQYNAPPPQHPHDQQYGGYSQQQYGGPLPGDYNQGYDQNRGHSPYPPAQQSYGAPPPQGYGDQGYQQQYNQHGDHGVPGAPGGPAEGERGLGSTLVGSAGGAFLGSKLGGGTLGTVGGMVAGAIAANMLGDKKDKKKKDKKHKHSSHHSGSHHGSSYAGSAAGLGGLYAASSHGKKHKKKHRSRGIDGSTCTVVRSVQLLTSKSFMTRHVLRASPSIHSVFLSRLSATADLRCRVSIKTFWHVPRQHSEPTTKKVTFNRMGDALVRFLRHTLPEELASVLEDTLQNLENGHFLHIFQLPEVQVLLGHQENSATKNVTLDDFPVWSDFVFHRLSLLLSKRNEEQGTPIQESAAYRQHLFFIVAVAALYAFVQSTITGPPLPFNSANTIFPAALSSDSTALAKAREELINSLAADGVAAYKLTPNIELLCLAETILFSPPIQKNIPASTWTRMRVDFIHQRLLSEVAPSLQQSIEDELKSLEHQLLSSGLVDKSPDVHVHFLLERGAIYTHHGLDKKAKEDLNRATAERKFVFTLTGMMGKRTKFQQKDTSQLLVLARSADTKDTAPKENEQDNVKPQNLDLNDDTLLEKISFTEDTANPGTPQDSSLPPALASLDPKDQPLLDPLDSVILLSFASSITNTNPADGLTREETLPYATRVLEGGSSNWQVYTQALLVRSRIEGYKSRTLERGLLQLQALVDQVIADTSPATPGPTTGETATTDDADAPTATSFLPKAKEGENAPVQDRLRYVFALASPSRWELEAELAARWVSVGGLRSALEIYERLEMWAEAALCWAATEKEGKAKQIVRRQLFHATNGNDDTADLEEEKWEGSERSPPPADAPRLYCILGDIDQDMSMYEKAWEVSGNRYARAQRSLGRHYFSQRAFDQAAEAYRLSLKVNALSHPSWFALGCAYLELQEFKNAVEAFSRCVQIDDEDAEAWSNLAAALLHLRPKTKPVDEHGELIEDDKPITSHPRQDALKAFKRAANLKHDNPRIWSNVLAVAASTNPPAWQDVINAQRRLCEIRGASEGEKCIDAEILDLLVKHAVQEVQEQGGFDATRPGLPRLVNEFVEKHVKPLITASPRLWMTLGMLYMHTGRPASALEAHEKAWRAVVSQPRWEDSGEESWNAVVEMTVELVDAYESLGPRERTEGLAAGSGEVVARDWKFKARSAVRSVMGKGKEVWENSAGWERLRERLEELKGRE